MTRGCTIETCLLKLKIRTMHFWKFLRFNFAAVSTVLRKSLYQVLTIAFDYILELFVPNFAWNFWVKYIRTLARSRVAKLNGAGWELKTQRARRQRTWTEHQWYTVYLINRPQFSMVYTLIDHRNDVSLPGGGVPVCNFFSVQGGVTKNL